METPKFDYFPPGFPLEVNDQMPEEVRSEMEAAIDAGQGLSAVHESMEYEQVRTMRRDEEYRRAVRKTFSDAGVNLISPSLGRMFYEHPNQVEPIRRDVMRWNARFQAVNWLNLATDPDEAQSIINRGDVGVVLNIQNLGNAIAGDVDEIENLYNAGIRIMQLTYNTQNFIGGAALDSDGGLSSHGRAVIETLNDLGVIIDLSHCGEQTTMDCIEASSAPVSFTHSFCRSLSDIPRGQTDEELDALADTDGYLGILMLPSFLAPGNETNAVPAFFDQLCYAVDRVGINRVGLATDWGFWTPTVPEPLRRLMKEGMDSFDDEAEMKLDTPFGPMTTYQERSLILDQFSEHGFSDRDVRKIMGENFLTYWQRVLAT